jgi:glycosyltransferase involved in cell wall biosynthesis
MLPTYCPDEKLAQSLASVLVQAPPATEMQIAVVDDGSPPGLVEEIVRSVDRAGRVDIVRHGERLGLAGNWNRAIDLAHGQLVHLLHQDDYVLPGFYARIDHGFRRLSDAGMAFCRTRLVNGEDRFLKNSSRLRWYAGPIRNWPAVIGHRQRLQTPGVVVPRTTYERLGGYRPDLCQALDWEMWVRIAARYPVWYEPRPLAAYRRHRKNESARLLARGDVWPDVIRTIMVNAASLPPQMRETLTAASSKWHAGSALRSAAHRLRAGDAAGARATLDHVAALIEMAGTAPGIGRLHARFRRAVARTEALLAAQGRAKTT